MVAFSCCIYDGDRKENIAMENTRERSWRGKFHRPGRVINPEANRRNGRCPLTPLEVEMLATPCNFFIYILVTTLFRDRKGDIKDSVVTPLIK
jgi:hypothetical protein